MCGKLRNTSGDAILSPFKRCKHVRSREWCDPPTESRIAFTFVLFYSSWSLSSTKCCFPCDTLERVITIIRHLAVSDCFRSSSEKIACRSKNVFYGFRDVVEIAKYVDGIRQ